MTVISVICCRRFITALLKGVRSIAKFKILLQIFYLESDFYEVAEDMKVVYCVLRNEENVIKNLNYKRLLLKLQEKNFFTEREEMLLSKKGKEVKEILEILKDKEFHSFRTFLLCLKELKQNNIISNIVRLNLDYPSSSVDNLAHFLRKRYTNPCFMESSDIDFNLSVSDDINITLIEISEKDHKDKSTFFDYYSLLLKQEGSYSKQFINLYSDIVVENCRVILIQGYPGSGKTFLAKRMCTQWANSKLLQSFTHVIFLQLRDEEVAAAITFDNLIQLYMGPLSEKIVQRIYEKNGHGILIVLEGWDELPERRWHSSLFTRLMLGDLLPEAVILITSRPSAIRSLPFKVIKRQIEILGFTEHQVKQNIIHHFLNVNGDNGPKIAEYFCSELRRLPLLRCFVFVPINLSIALYIFHTNNCQLPSTFTDMYINLVLIQLRRYQAKVSSEITSIENLYDLPYYIGDMLLRLGKMAYDEISKEELTLIFDELQIKHYCFDSSKGNLESFDGMGLLQVTNHRRFESISKTYQFIHRTLQELLAAWYISQQPKSFQQQQLQKLFNKKEFEMIWIFYAGLTKFSFVSFKDFLSSNWIQKIKILCYKYSTYFIKVFLHDRFAALHGLNILLQKFYSSKQYSIYISQCISREFQTTLITAVMEAQNPRLCKEMCSSYLFYGDTCWFSVPESAATPQILSALSYCIAYSKKDWIVHCKGLDSDQADYLLKYLNSSKPSSDNRYKMCSTITVFDVIGSQSRIDGVLKLVQTPQCPQWLILSNCKLVDDDFMAMLSDALMDNNYLKQISLNSCNFNSKNVLSVVRLLKKNRTLECIYLQGNMTTLTEKDVLLLLQTIHRYNDIIYALLIDKIFCTADKVQEQLKIINNVREQKGVTQLRLSLYVGGGGIFRKLCQRVITSSTTHCSAKVSFIMLFQLLHNTAVIYRYCIYLWCTIKYCVLHMHSNLCNSMHACCMLYRHSI